MRGKALQDPRVSYLKDYVENTEDFKSKITDDFRSLTNLLQVFRAITSQYTLKAIMIMQKEMQEKGLYDAYLQSLPF